MSDSQSNLQSCSSMLAAGHFQKSACCSQQCAKSCAAVSLHCPSRLLSPSFIRQLPFLSSVDGQCQHVSRQRSQLISCKASPSGRKGDEGTAVSVPQSEDESVSSYYRPASDVDAGLAPALDLRLGRMPQISQAVAALSLKMGQGKKGGKPTKVGMFSLAPEYNLGWQNISQSRNLCCWCCIECHAWIAAYRRHTFKKELHAGLQERQSETTQRPDTDSRRVSKSSESASWARAR